MKKVTIIKYNAGNTRSVVCALNRLDINPIISDSAEEISNSDFVIFPGVGEASSAMSYLVDRRLDQIILNLKQPVLGICLGLQLLCSKSEENNTKCLGIFDEEVKKFTLEKKVPQIGWNTIDDLNSIIFKNIEEKSYLYFVHSYYAELGENTISKSDYGDIFSSALSKDNFYATQFHPEKSGDIGEKILRNFLND